MRRVHEFTTTTEAYGATQCGEAWRNGAGEADGAVVPCEDGDVLVIAAEGVVGVCDTWPVAVTAAMGALHYVVGAEFLGVPECGVSGHDVREAVKIARERGFAVAEWADAWYPAWRHTPPYENPNA